MTREEARKAAEVMMAYADGKNVEYKRLTFSGDSWCEIVGGEPVFDWHHAYYRIKKESTYRPFKDKEDCWAEMQKHQPFGWMKDKKTGTYIVLLISVTKMILFIFMRNQLLLTEHHSE